MSGLIKDSWVFTSTSAFNLLRYIVLVEGYKEIWLHTNLRSWRSQILIVFSHTCGHFFFDTIPNLGTQSFLKVSCDVNLNHLMNFSYPDPLKSIAFSQILSNFKVKNNSLQKRECWETPLKPSDCRLTVPVVRATYVMEPDLTPCRRHITSELPFPTMQNLQVILRTADKYKQRNILQYFSKVSGSLKTKELLQIGGDQGAGQLKAK